MTFKNRLNRLEKHAPALPWIVFTQDDGDPDLWHDATGGIANTARLEELAKTHNVMRVTWDQDWRGDADKHIRLTWGDD